MKYVKVILILLILLTLLSCSKKSTQTDNTTVKKPVFLLPSGEYEAGQYIAIRCDTEDAEIHYTLDNSEPVLSSPIYTQELRIPDFFVNGANYCIIKARAFKTGFLPSAIASATYSLNYENTVATPVLTPAGDSFNHNLSVTVSCSTPGANIRYTTDGTEPSYYSLPYGSAIAVNKDMTIIARAFKQGMNASLVATNNYNLSLEFVEGYFNGDELRCIAIRDNYAYITSVTMGFAVLDITDPANITVVGSHDFSVAASNILLDGNYAYVANGLYGLQIFNISDPANPDLIGSIDTPSNIKDLALVYPNMYALNVEGTVNIINISNPANPVMTNSFSIPTIGSGIAVQGNYLFVSTTSNGLRIYSLTNPLNPTYVGSYSIPMAADVCVSGNYAYVASVSSGIKIINISNPASPVLAGSFNDAGNMQNVFLSGNLLYVASGQSGLRIVDVTDPVHPVLHGYFETGYENNSVVVNGQYIYLTAWYDDLTVLKKD
ncbi:MAG: chitobiase/beta-hexosaminidase C-terminal domain-containing protein [Candidatus Cloacimonadaceae bacterium]